MDEKQSFIKSVMMLVIVCISAGLLLSVAYILTYDRINAFSSDMPISELQKVINASAYKRLSTENSILYSKFNDSSLKEIYLVYDDNSIIGSIFEVVAVGYRSDLRFYVGYSFDEIKAIHIINADETPGIGTRILESSFLSQFISHKMTDIEFDTISGATVSSSAIIETVTYRTRSLLADLSTDEAKSLGIEK